MYVKKYIKRAVEMGETLKTALLCNDAVRILSYFVQTRLPLPIVVVK